jgi:capsular exopolysaccharide synthesis family protein
MPEEHVEIEKIQPIEEAPVGRPSYPSHCSQGSYGYGYGYANAEDEGMHLRDVWRIIRKRKWLIVSLTLVVTTVVAVQMYRTQSTYQASMLVEVEKAAPSATKTGDIIVQDNDLDSLKTKMLMVKSQPLLEDVVKRLRLDQNQKFLRKDDSKPVMQAVKEMLGRSTHPQTPTDGAETSGSQAYAANPQGETAQTGNEPGEPDAKTAETLATAVDSALTVDLVRDTRAIKISFTHSDPGLAAAIANQVGKSFIDLSFKNQTSQFTNTSDWLDRSTRELKAKVEKAEQALADYTKEHHIFSTDGKETLTTEKLSRLHDQLTRAQTDRLLKQSLYEELKAGRLAQLPETYLDPRQSALRSKLGELQSQAAELAVKYGPKNPKLIEINQQVTITQQQMDAGMQALEDKLKGEYARAVADEKSLGVALDEAKFAAERENQDAIQFSILKQEVETSKSLYTDFLQKTNQANLEVAEQHPSMHVIQPALIPKIPVGPRRTTNTLIALVLSLGAGIGLVFFLEYLDNTIKSVEDVTRYIQLPALGVIPAISTSPARQLLGKKKTARQASLSVTSSAKPAPGQALVGRLQNAEGHSSAAEAYRALRTSVLLSAAGSPPKTLLVTSGQPGEGKTTTVVNTAISLAQLGAEVLIIDADLRKPNVHKVFGLDPSRGLSTYLSRNASIDSLIQKPAMPHMSVLASGPIPPNPAELISSDKMKDMLRKLSERYDHILIDSPPLINVTDPVILSTEVDGVVLVVSWGKSTRDIARRVRAELTSVGAKIFGVVLNNVNFRHEGYDDYYYYRYYTNYGHSKDAPA